MKSKGFKLGGQLGEICVVVGVRRVGVAEKERGGGLVKRSDRKGSVFQIKLSVLSQPVPCQSSVYVVRN